MKTLKELKSLHNNDPGTELKSLFDNCPGSNKNNYVLQFVPYLVETNYFFKVTFSFLVVGQTKKAHGRLFNKLKK